MADSIPRGAKSVLEDIRPKEVSLVDRAANECTFLVVKRRGTDQKEIDMADIERDEHGNLIEKGKSQDDDNAQKGGLDATLRTAGEKLMALADKAKGKALDATAGAELKAVAGMLQEALKGYPAPATKDASDPDAAVKFDLLVAGGSTDSGVLAEMTSRIAKFASYPSDEERGRQLSGMVSMLTALAKAAKPGKPGEDEEEEEDMKARKAKKAEGEDEEEEKGKAANRKRFTPQRTAKLLQGLASIAEVMKEVDADSLGALFAVAKSEQGEEATLVAKRLTELAPEGKVQVITKSADSELVSELRDQLADVRKRLAKCEDSAVSKSLGSDGEPITKKSGVSWKGVL